MGYKEREPCIYVIRRIGTDECYVGQTVCVRDRWRRHRRSLERGDHHSSRMQNVYNKHGMSSFEISILEKVPLTDKTRTNLVVAEQRWLDALKPCYNTAPVAGSILGVKFSKEVCKKLSEIRKKYYEDPKHLERLRSLRKGLPSPWKGKHPTEEQLALMSANRKGIAVFTGQKHTDEAKEKMSAAKKGKPSPNRGRPRTAAATAKQSATMKAKYAALIASGQTHPSVGRSFSEETRAKMSIAKKGKTHSPDRRSAQSERVRAWWASKKAAET